MICDGMMSPGLKMLPLAGMCQYLFVIGNLLTQTVMTVMTEVSSEAWD